jgi:hypothetical protein
MVSDPGTYNQAMIGQPDEAYSQWILDPEKWGGEDVKIFRGHSKSIERVGAFKQLNRIAHSIC